MKLHIFIILFLFTQTLFAQENTSDNNYIVGGTMNFLYQKNTYPILSLNIGAGIGSIYSNNTEDVRNFYFGIQPYFGKVISANWTLGFELDCGIRKYDAYDVVFNTGTSSTSIVDLSRNSSEIGGGLFARYTFNPEQRFNFYLQPVVRYHFLNEKNKREGEVTQKEKVNYMAVDANLGVLYAATKRLNVNLRFGAMSFITGRWKIDDSDISNNFTSFNTNLRLSSLSFGLEFRL